MFERVLKQMREHVRTSKYVMTAHGEEEMENDELSIYDVESCILTGEVIERQKDKETAEWKYLIQGQTVQGDSIRVVTKQGPTGRTVIITVYRV